MKEKHELRLFNITEESNHKLSLKETAMKEM